MIGVSSAAAPLDPNEVYSRTIGALGRRTWERLSSLEVVVAGAGRAGGLIAEALARFGVRRLILLDPDRIEPGNLGEATLLSGDAVGELKVDAYAAALTAPATPLQVTPLPVSVMATGALVAIKSADVVISCVDNPVAHLATASVAQLYVKPLLDLGSGIFDGESPTERRMGADIRLIVPGAGSCLLCLGGVGDRVAARAALTAPLGAVPSPVPWSHQMAGGLRRSGSLRSLNLVVVGLALRLLEDFIAGRVVESRWEHVEFDARGVPSLELRTLPLDPRCPLCALTARGDAGIAELPAVFASL
ncbi:MAG: ThiF family adenylyltransferase [Chloroflexi bacterium]|nr:ThiF family adenylyltransferase [Chloroflexota bacterium]